MRRLSIGLLLASAAFAQQLDLNNVRIPAPKPLPPFQLPQRVGVFAETPLALNDVIRMVVANNRDIELTRIDTQRSDYNIVAARGAYDPRFGYDVTRTRQVSPVSSIIGGTASGKLTQTDLNLNPYVSGVSPFGGSYRLDFSASKQNTDSTFVTLNPQYPTVARLNLTQPLWRGFRFDQTRYQIQVAQRNRAITLSQLRQRLTEDLTQAIEAYWELNFAYRNLQVQVDAVSLARQQDESNRRQVEQGILAPVDVVQTQTQLATFEQNVYAAQETLTRAENALKSMILADRADPLWGSALIPNTPGQLEATAIPLKEAVEIAVRARPEIEQVGISGQLNALDTRLNREQTRPQVDLVTTLASSGLAGVPSGASGSNPFADAFGPLFGRLNQLSALAGLPPIGAVAFGGGSTIPALLVGGYGQSLSNLYNGYFPTVTVGLRVALPLRNRTAQANLASSELLGRRIKVQQQQTELLIEADVRNTFQAEASARSRLDAAILARKSAEEQYRSEQRQFQAGTSSVFLVLQRQTDLIAARSRELRAQTDLEKALRDRDRAMGTTLETTGIAVK